MEKGKNEGGVRPNKFALPRSKKQAFSISFKLHSKILQRSLSEMHDDTPCRNETGHACREP